LNPTRYGRLPIALPKLDEQRALVRHIRGAGGELDSGIDAATRAVLLLREYRIRLVADVVTGKLDVREAAARLPDEPDEAEADDGVSAAAEENETCESATEDGDAGAEEVEEET
jgi:type I restriction enzyme S subunit